MKKPVSLLLTLVICLIFCACNNSGVKESEILSDIPEQFLTAEGQNLDYNSIEVSKRNTEDGIDNIYFTLKASNDNYEATAQCHFQYNYYSEGGWILDYTEIVNGEYTLVPLSGCSSNSENEYMQENYMNYQLVDSDFGSDDSSYYTKYIYEASNEWVYYSQNVSVSYIYTFITELSPWEYSENVYCYDISTRWSCDRHEDIISDNWVLDLDIEATRNYDDDDTIRMVISPANDGSCSIKYYANKLQPGFLYGWSEYEGEGTAEYEVKYDANDDKYICFVMQLYYINDDGSYDYNNPYNHKVSIYKDSVVIRSASSTYLT